MPHCRVPSLVFDAAEGVGAQMGPCRVAEFSILVTHDCFSFVCECTPSRRCDVSERDYIISELDFPLSWSKFESKKSAMRIPDSRLAFKRVIYTVIFRFNFQILDS